MQELLAQARPELDRGSGEHTARAQLRRQVARLERELGELVGEGFARVEVPHVLTAAPGPPRMLDLGELERTRDALVGGIAEARAALSRRAAAEASSRELLRAMLARPEEFKWVRVTRAELGEPGCGNWHSKPRLGPLGDADGLVAGQGLGGMPETRAACGR